MALEPWKDKTMMILIREFGEYDRNVETDKEAYLSMRDQEPDRLKAFEEIAAEIDVPTDLLEQLTKLREQLATLKAENERLREALNPRYHAHRSQHHCSVCDRPFAVSNHDATKEPPRD